MKVCLVVTDYSKYGGCERVAINLANAFVRQHEVILIGGFQRKKEIPYKIDCRVKKYILLEGQKRLRNNFWQALKKKREVINLENPDFILYVNVGTYIFSLASLGKNIIKLGCEHTNLSNKYHTRSLFFKILRIWSVIYFNYIVTLTETDKKMYQKKYKTNRVTNIYNWIPNNVINFGKKSNMKSTRIISVGRFDPVKGYENLIEVAKIVLQQNEKWEWHIWGDGDKAYKDRIAQMIIDYNLEKKVFIHNSTEKIYDKYIESSILVMTSYYEGLPMVLLEGLALGLPMVSFDCKTGPNEIIKNSENGFLIDCYNIGEMADKIQELIDNYDLRCRFAEKSLILKSAFSEEIILTEWERLFKELSQ